ncbi:MAG: thioredoxin domain-containing protein [Bacteroidetes bacterium]|nr:thioredoxin domain-containing protein [Bacteroidota bacterium]
MRITMANKLIYATSPYLLQHAHNPVHWQEWGTEALAEAKATDKPILISIGYSACHWCHVMEKQSFENKDIADLMNEYFICIKIDREERPDLDQVYMEAVQAMGIHGGWPLNVFLTPDQKPFYGGTYFPPASWSKLLQQVAHTYNAKRAEINQSADELAHHLHTSDLQRFVQEENNNVFVLEKLNAMFFIMQNKFDATWGGIEKAPKFVMPAVWLWLLRYYYISKNESALHMVTHTLKQMTRAGLYDQLGGGFARYSVDAEWVAPHFEKMLYDNAQLLSIYAEAFAVTKDDFFKTIVYETVGWLTREMTHTEGGFYSALDADSEGTEGKYYTWSWSELEAALDENKMEAANYFHCTQEGNWEHEQNILIREPEQIETESIKKAKEKLLAYREKKTRPSLDDKILTGWNAMTICGLADCYKAFGDEWFLHLALKNISFIEKYLIDQRKVFRSFKNKHSATEGFLEDYAFLVRAYTSVYEVTFQEKYLAEAERWTNFVIENFYDTQEKYFSFTSHQAEKLIARKKEIFDNVIPSSNAVMARNLFRLGAMLDKNEWKQRATEMTSKLSSIISSEPVYMCYWGILFAEISEGLSEVVIVGNEWHEIRREIQSNFIPFAVYAGTKSKSELPLLQGRESIDGKTKIYICRNNICNLPVTHVKDALQQIHS